MHLVTVEDSAEQAFLLNEIKKDGGEFIENKFICDSYVFTRPGAACNVVDFQATLSIEVTSAFILSLMLQRNTRIL